MKRSISSIIIIALLLGLFYVSGQAEEGDENLEEQQQELVESMHQQEAETQATISNLEKQTKETRDAISALQGQKDQTQSNISNLENQSTKLQSTINSYSNKLSDLDEDISEAEAALAEVSAEIVQLDSELQEARKQEKDRYELIKKRIKATYESGGSKGLLRIMLESGSLQEFLTTSEYLNAVLAYDNRVIQEYRALQADIEQKTAVVQEKEAQLDQYQAQLDEKHDELADLTDAVRGQLSSTRNSISSEKNKLADFDNQLKELDKKMKSLESQTAAAQAKLAQQIAERLALTKEDTSGAYAASASELEWLAATIQAEAGGESYTGKLAVGSVIMNRVKSSAFPNTIIEVITQNMQFASYRSGKVELIIANGPNSTCIQAANEVLSGVRVGDYLFFMTQYYADYYCISEYTMIGNHAFFYRWVTKPKPEPVPEETPQEIPQEQQPQEEQQEQQEQQEEENQENEEASHSEEQNSDEQSQEDNSSDDDGCQ